MPLLRQRHLFALATYGLPPPGPSKPPRIPLPGPGFVGEHLGDFVGEPFGIPPAMWSFSPLQYLCASSRHFLTHKSRAKLLEFRSLLSTACALFHFPYPINPVFATLTRTAGVYTNNSQLGTNLSPLATAFKFFLFTLFHTLLRSSKTQLFSFHAVPHSLRKTPGVGVGLQRHS